MRSARSSPTNVRADRLILACVVTTMVFVVYSRTLLPGVDLGDTGGFQAAVLWPETTARQAYPLYYGLAAPFVAAVSPGNPARGLNLFSAVFASVAAGLLASAVAAVAGSLLAGAAAGMLLAFSYTFWTQAVIAEVYALHLALVAACLVSLGGFARHPSRGRLAVFCALYAAGFGNHLSMILLFVPFTAFILLSHPQPRELFRRGVIGMALAIAAAGALLYVPNVLALWSSIEAPEAFGERAAAFWFDVTKSDWRGSMVLGVAPGQTDDRLAMWAWDARQQFGVPGLVLAAAGALRVWWISRPWAVLLWTAYVISTLFALTYNVGDAHVFFLPGHFFTACFAGLALSPPATWPPHAEGPARTTRRVAAALVATAAVAYAGWRGWETWPATDRHDDHRAATLIERLLLGVDEQNAVLVSNLNWEQENGLLYVARYGRRDVSWVRLLDVMPHFPFLVRDNLGIGRDVVLTADAAAAMVSAFGDHFPLARDEVPPVARLSSVVERLQRGTPYVLTMLPALAAYPHDAEDLERSIASLTGGRSPARSPASYEVIAGAVGEAPAVSRGSDRPFHLSTRLLGDDFTVRMDAWLPADTFRRGGFGHVLRGRERVLFIERGVSLVWFTGEGAPRTVYAAGLYAPQPRFRIPATVTRLAAMPR